MSAHRGKTKNISVRRRALLSDWRVNIKVNQIARNGRAWREMWSVLWTLRTRRATLFWTFVVSLSDTEDSWTGGNCNTQGAKEQKAETRIFVASVDRRWLMELMRRNLKLAEPNFFSCSLIMPPREAQIPKQAKHFWWINTDRRTKWKMQTKLFAHRLCLLVQLVTSVRFHFQNTESLLSVCVDR